MAIHNIVFDVGNVLVRWDPTVIIAQTFPGSKNHPQLVQDIFKHASWQAHNLGHLTEEQLIAEYHQRLALDQNRLVEMMAIVKESLIPVPGSIELLKALHETKQYHLYALTDNTHEIMKYLKNKYDFWPLFQGVVVSAEVGWLKPAPEIYAHLLKTYQLLPHETVFIDDFARNIEGAKIAGIHGIQFENSLQCIKALQALNVLL